MFLILNSLTVPLLLMLMLMLLLRRPRLEGNTLGGARKKRTYTIWRKRKKVTVSEFAYMYNMRQCQLLTVIVLQVLTIIFKFSAQ